MEQVLEVYKRPEDPKRPVVCMDEAPRQLIAETRAPLAAQPGQPLRYDFEYERKGTFWQKQRNDAKDVIRWRFTTEDARIKLHRLYPTIEG